MDNNEHEDQQQQEEKQKIPVFTVLKNNTILKNIFLLQNPISVTNQESSDELENLKNRRIEEILTVGRHPDCTIMLTHPSISRFHLRIYLDSSLEKMSVIDLASVHGTWVSDRRIEPGVRVELNEGDTIQMGCSSRVYRMHWVSLSIALDLENPIEDDGSLLYGDKQVESLDSISEVVESYSYEENIEYLAVNEVQSTSPMPVEELKTDAEKVSDHCSLEEDHEQRDNTIPCLDPTTSFTLYDDSVGMSDEEKTSNYDSLEEYQEQLENIIPGSEPTEEYLFNADCEEIDHEFQPDVELYAAQRLLVDEPEKELHLEDMYDDGKISNYDSLEVYAAQRLLVDEPEKELHLEDMYDDGKISNYDSLEEDQKQLENIIPDVELFGGYLFDADYEKVDDEYQLNVDPSAARHLLDQDEPGQGSSLCFNESVQVNNHRASINVIADVEPNAVQDLLEDESDMPHNLNLLCFDEPIQVKNQSPSIDVVAEKEYTQPKAESETTPLAESINVIADVEPNAAQDLLEDESDMPRNLNLLCLDEPIQVKNRSPSIDVVAEKEYTQHEAESETTPLSPYAENEISDQRLTGMGNIWSRRGSVPQIQTGSVKGSTTEVGTTEHEVFMKFGDEDENYTPNKENVTPNPHLALSKEGKGTERQKKHLTPFKSSSSSSKLAISRPTLSSDKENQTPSNGRKISARKSSFGNRVSRVGRVPFQSLLLNSGKSSPSAVNCVQSLDNITNVYSKNTAGEAKKKMWYMVVDSSTLLDKKSMKALRLLHGLKGIQLIIPKTVIRELDHLKLRAMFRRQTEVFTALKWIEECTVVSCKQWIHIQNSFDEGVRIALTPPASPQTIKSLLGAVSPKPEDHILEDVLLHKRLKNDGQLILLSNNVNLKIKAMAEGVICETADDFRESLVNPFSDRFMWAESSPRGQTWSCSDDLVLRDIYYPCQIKKSASKGLKLILLHNSHYGQIKTVS